MFFKIKKIKSYIVLHLVKSFKSTGCSKSSENFCKMQNCYNCFLSFALELARNFLQDAKNSIIFQPKRKIA